MQYSFQLTEIESFTKCFQEENFRDFIANSIETNKIASLELQLREFSVAIYGSPRTSFPFSIVLNLILIT
jgi:hypothetical protein